MSTDVNERKKEILQNKLEHYLNDKQLHNFSTIEKIDYDSNNLADYVVPLGKNSPLDFDANGQMYLVNGEQRFSLHKHGLRQLSTKLEIPYKYAEYLASSEWGRQLLKEAFQQHRNNISRGRILIRSIDNEVRGVLSDKYRRLNSLEIYRDFMEGSRSQGAEVIDSLYTDTKTYIKTVIPKVFEIPTENNGTIFTVFGARISNSDFGDGAFSLRQFQLHVVCMNGMVGEKLLHQIHLGKRLPDNVHFSDKTYRLDTQAMASAVKDIMKDIYGPEKIKNMAQKLVNASNEIIDMDTQMKRLPSMGMIKSEVEEVGAKLMNSNEEDGLIGKPTRWKLSQAITSVANDIGGRRKEELSTLAGELLKL